jgi:hypothetical protein
MTTPKTTLLILVVLCLSVPVLAAVKNRGCHQSHLCSDDLHFNADSRSLVSIYDDTSIDIDLNDDSSMVIADANHNGATRSTFFRSFDENGHLMLTYYGLMIAGAVARTVAATAVHPLNVIKTVLQTKDVQLPSFRYSDLMRGSGSQLICSIPHGAFSFAVIETTKKKLLRYSRLFELTDLVPEHVLNSILDFSSSCVSTLICSIVSTPQMVITDRIMAKVYPNFFEAILRIWKSEGIVGFYAGWLPAIVQKIPSYALTWMLFQQLKLVFMSYKGRKGTAFENTCLGSVAAAGACCIMIPIDTIKTRIVTQRPGEQIIYSGLFDCFFKILKNEGAWAFYRALPPRLFAVVPMIGIQFSTYEFMKRFLLNEHLTLP